MFIRLWGMFILMTVFISRMRAAVEGFLYTLCRQLLDFFDLLFVLHLGLQHL